MNSPTGSLFFERKSGSKNPSASNGASSKQLDDDIQRKVQQQKKLDLAIKDLDIAKISLDNDMIKQEMNLKSIQQKLSMLNPNYQTCNMIKTGKPNPFNMRMMKKLNDLLMTTNVNTNH